MSLLLFSPGQLVATPAALEAVRESGDSVLALLRRHLLLEQGELDDHDHAVNKQALVYGTRILSSFKLKSGTTLWIITDGADENGIRHCTTVLLPEDY